MDDLGIGKQESCKSKIIYTSRVFHRVNEKASKKGKTDKLVPIG